LYDTRVSDWSHKPPLRARYAWHSRTLGSLAEVKAALRAGPYAWPGGYECFFITADGAVLSYEAARDEFRQIVWDYLHNASTGWRVVALGCMAECGEPVVCDHTGCEIT
jgi:hypothetical protein